MALFRFTLLLVLIASTIAPAQASIGQYLVYKAIQAKIEALHPVTPPRGSHDDRSGSYDQRLDHFTASDQRTFKQRYVIYNSYAPSDSTNAPVIYYQCGEGNCLDSGMFAVPSAIAYYAQKLGAVIVILEHRYYGKSQPFATMTGDNLKYLTYEQALEDFAQFQLYATDTFHLHGKWIFAGGSYSGALSAYYRLKHPELVVGALSSSGVVKTELNYEDYDRVVATSLSPQCLTAVKNVTHQVEQALGDPARLASIQATFQSSDIKSGLDFLSVLDTMVSAAVQYGMQGSFCDTLLGSSDPIAGFAQAGLDILSALQITPLMATYQGIESVNASDYEGYVGMRQWVYQSCREFGGFAVPYHDPAQSAESTLLDSKYDLEACKALFGLGSPPDTNRMNQEYYKPLLDPSRASQILYANGALDPYMPLSITRENGNDTNPNTLAITLPGASHCADLDYSVGESGPAADLHQRFLNLAKTWLAP